MTARALRYLLIPVALCAALSLQAQLRAVPDTAAARLRQSKEFRYANDPAFWSHKPPPDESAFLAKLAMFLQSSVWRWVLYILLTAIVVIVIHQIFRANDFSVFSRRSRRLSNAAGSESDPLENVDALLNAAVQANDFRLATRFHYLRTLRTLSERGRITLQAKATNHDYEEQLSNSPVAREFRALTALYEYVWYGEYIPSSSQFARIEADFQQFNNSL